MSKMIVAFCVVFCVAFLSSLANAQGSDMFPGGPHDYGYSSGPSNPNDSSRITRGFGETQRRDYQQQQEMQRQPSYTPPPSRPQQDNPYNMPRGVWTPDGKYMTCQRSFQNTVCF